MRHCSVQVRGLLTRDELDRYNALIEVGSFLESQMRHDLAYTVQKEIDILILPAIERLKDKGRERDRATKEYLEAKVALVWVIYPRARVVLAFRPDGTVQRFTAADRLVTEDLFPGFSCRVEDLFAIP